MRNTIIILFCSIVFINTLKCQNLLNSNITYGIHKVYPPISISKDALYKATTLNDLYPNFKSDWIKTYRRVEILTLQNGKMKRATGKNDLLNQKQKEHIYRADNGTDAQVNVQYIPINGLKNNEPKWLRFAFQVNPENAAVFATGKEQLNQYLKEKIIDRIADTIFKQYQLTVVKFTINEEGEVIEPKISESSGDEQTDQLLVETICHMPKWKPASYANGLTTKEEFVLTIGDMESCVVNLLNIQHTKDKFSK